jgi:modulator of FtsH protease HflC
MKYWKPITIFIFTFVVIILLAGSIFVVDETQQVVVTQFGKPVGNAITTPGIKIKVPFIQKANYFDKRYLEWDGAPNEVPTKDKKYIFVDTYARWQITDPLQFFKRLTDERGAQSRLDDILDGETRDFVANYALEETVRSTNRTPVSSGDISEEIGDSLVPISVGRERIQAMILESANKQAKDLGVVILDFQFKRINYAQENVLQSVYNRMTSERNRIADKFRSEGQGQASEINGERDRDLRQIRSEAFRDAEVIKGQADSTAAAIYASAYNQTPQSRELYAFLKSMETLKKTFDQQTSVVLSTKSEMYKYLKGM